MSIIVKEGLRIHVFDLDKNYLGVGTIIEVKSVFDDYSGAVVSNTYPIILLDSGERTEGMDCFWYPVEEARKEGYDI